MVPIQEVEVHLYEVLGLLDLLWDLGEGNGTVDCLLVCPQDHPGSRAQVVLLHLQREEHRLSRSVSTQEIAVLLFERIRKSD